MALIKQTKQEIREMDHETAKVFTRIADSMEAIASDIRIMRERGDEVHKLALPVLALQERAIKGMVEGLEDT